MNPNLFSSATTQTSNGAEVRAFYKPPVVKLTDADEPIGEQYCQVCLQDFATKSVNRIDLFLVSCRV